MYCGNSQEDKRTIIIINVGEWKRIVFSITGLVLIPGGIYWALVCFITSLKPVDTLCDSDISPSPVPNENPSAGGVFLFLLFLIRIQTPALLFGTTIQKG